MTGRWRRYAEYRPSGVDWIGSIPRDWNVRPVKRNARLRVEPALGGALARPFLGLDQIEPWCGRLTAAASEGDAEDGESGIVYNTGDVLFSKLRPYLAKALAPSGPGRCTGELLVMRPDGVDPRFLLYTCLSRGFIETVDGRTYGTKMPRASWDIVGSLSVPTPDTLDQQKSIAAFLDRETGRIDVLIATKERQIELLGFKDEAVIHTLVTKGLDPSVERAQTGIPWVRDAPVHWRPMKLSWCFRIIGSGTTPKTSDRAFYEGGTIPWVTTTELRETTITDTASKVTERALAEHSALKLYPIGTLLVAMYGATIGRLGWLGVEATVNQACCCFAHPVGVNPEFIYYWLLSCRGALVDYFGAGGGQGNISKEKLCSLRIPMPNKDEQDAIVARIRAEVGRGKPQADAIRRTITLLREQRQALITAAVTGQIDVRGEVSLPEGA